MTRTCGTRTLEPPPIFDDKETEADLKTGSEDDISAGNGDRPDFSAWKVAIKNLNK